MNKPNPMLRERNEKIRSLFWQYIREGVPYMEAYIRVGMEYDLSDDRIREIVARIKC